MPAAPRKAAAAKLSRAEKKAARVERRGKRRAQFSQMWEVFKLTRQADKAMLALVLTAFLGTAAIVWSLGWLITANPYVPIPFAVLIGLLPAMFVFSRRAQAAMYTKADGQPGAALYVLQNLRGDWTMTEAVSATTQFDAVHRVVGRPGVVLVGEGAPHRVKGLLAQEKRRVARLVGDTPIYDYTVGNGDGQTQLRKLNTQLLKLPRNLTREQVTSLNKRLAALSSTRPPLPQGPMPAGAKIRNPGRAVRRRT